MEIADVEEQGKMSEQFNVLAQQMINLAATGEEFFCNMATKLNEPLMPDLQGVTKPSHHGSAPRAVHLVPRHERLGWRRKRLG